MAKIFDKESAAITKAFIATLNSEFHVGGTLGTATIEIESLNVADKTWSSQASISATGVTDLSAVESGSPLRARILTPNGSTSITGALVGSPSIYDIVNANPETSPVLSGEILETKSSILPIIQGSVLSTIGTGNVYWVITQSATTPTFSQIIDGLDNTDAMADFSGVIPMRVVTKAVTKEVMAEPDTSYYFHAVHESQLGLLSSAVSSAVATAPDTISPVLSNPTDIPDGVTNTQGDGTVDTDEGDGTLYTVVTESATAPSGDQIVAGTDENDIAATFATSQAVVAPGTQNIAFTGLTASTTYYAHYYQLDSDGNASNIVSGDGFTTIA